MRSTAETYRKDLSHTTWDRVFQHQVERAPLAREWLDRLNLQPGQCVLDAGSGPGFVSLLAAQRVGPEGLVYAVDASAEAVARLRQALAEQPAPQVRPLVADVTQLDTLPRRPDAALVTMMLHHADDGPAVLGAVARLLPPGGRCVVAEFHPAGPCQVGPPREHRLAPDVVRRWCVDAGFTVLEEWRQSSEHYALLLERTGPAAPAGVE
ncbi:MAG: class I SAM-dependent methyltransferase, partial [Clostridia bacterium]|nr:class I SAM-dependent methyltransferase [Clostridia bacterium]